MTLDAARERTWCDSRVSTASCCRIYILLDKVFLRTVRAVTCLYARACNLFFMYIYRRTSYDLSTLCTAAKPKTSKAQCRLHLAVDAQTGRRGRGAESTFLFCRTRTAYFLYVLSVYAFSALAPFVVMIFLVISDRDSAK